MLIPRLITAVIGVPVIVGLIAVGGIPYVAAVAIILVVAALEFFATTATGSPNATSAKPLYQPSPGGVIGATVVLWAVLGVAVVGNGAQWMLAGALVLLAFMFRTPAPWRIIGGVGYIGFLGMHLVLLRDLQDGPEWTFLAVLSTFATDTSAYIVGRAFGRVHITPKISPGKTLEGSLAGFAGGFIAVVLVNWISGLDVDLSTILPLAVLLPIAAMSGDLTESLIKRRSGVKDAGDLVPGHGGLLDRLDSILFTAPLVYYYVIWTVL